MQLNKHPILKQWYETMGAIEDCGASEKLTNASVKCGDLGKAIEKLIDENKLSNLHEWVVRKGEDLILEAEVRKENGRWLIWDNNCDEEMKEESITLSAENFIDGTVIRRYVPIE